MSTPNSLNVDVSDGYQAARDADTELPCHTLGMWAYDALPADARPGHSWTTFALVPMLIASYDNTKQP